MNHSDEKKAGKRPKEVLLSDKITMFISLASKSSANPYYNQSEQLYLKSIGESLGLPHPVIDEVIRSNAVNNAKLLKDISLASVELRELKAAYAYTLQTLQRAKACEGHKLTYKTTATGLPTYSGTSITNSEAQSNPYPSTASAQQYQSSIAGLQNHIGQLKATTGGEGDNRFRDAANTKLVFKAIQTDKSRIPLAPLTKQFTYEK